MSGPTLLDRDNLIVPDYLPSPTVSGDDDPEYEDWMDDLKMKLIKYR